MRELRSHFAAVLEMYERVVHSRPATGGAPIRRPSRPRRPAAALPRS